jgi:hypothetical protein
VGISVFGLLTARVAAIFVEAQEEDHNGRKLDEVLARLESLEQELRQQRESAPDDHGTQLRGAPSSQPPPASAGARAPSPQDL